MNNVYTLELDGLFVRLKETHNFGWIHKFGEVFCVFDSQDSGNISFGVEKDGDKKFIKYAGANPINYKGEPEEAILKLKKARTVYEKLENPHLVKLVDYLEMEKGYLHLYEWFDGLNIQRNNAPSTAYQRFMRLPLELRLKSLTTIFEFHLHVERSNYVAIDFYDGSILYDFQRHITKICDVDLYHTKPFYNQVGRLWGSSRIMSPEEFTIGAEIDAQSNVYNMGATAFSIIGGSLDGSANKWKAGKELYWVARKAVEIERDKRHSSVEEFYEDWKSSL